MARMQSKVSADGRISIPAEIRHNLGIGPGSIVEWDPDGEHVIVRNARRYSSEDIHRAIFARPAKARTLDDLKEGIRHLRKALKKRERWTKGLPSPRGETSTR
jgi:AbrB family looped-hinge helix DNA binding protein